MCLFLEVCACPAMKLEDHGMRTRDVTDDCPLSSYSQHKHVSSVRLDLSVRLVCARWRLRVMLRGCSDNTGMILLLLA